MGSEHNTYFWYKKAIFYEISINSFYDSNIDGYGDFQGLIQKLDYLQDLGITCIWLLPFYPSPWRDDGYDITDYCGIHPKFGTLDDFDEFISEAHKRNIRVIGDLVINHTSIDHPWFQEARSSKNNPKRNYYVWSDDGKMYLETRVIFNDTNNSNWSYDQISGQYYWHRFFSSQADLNFECEDVHKEILTIIDFWLDKGMDGFRIDAIPYLYEEIGTSNEGLPKTHEFLRKLRKHVDERYGEYQKVLLAEANQEAEELLKYYGNGDELHMAFHFPLMPRLFYALAKENTTEIINIIKFTLNISEQCQWCLFLRNHDELTLEKVSEDFRTFMWNYYAPEPKMRLNLGIRRRLAPLLAGNREKIALLNSVIFALPGSPIIYYGDEIGMGDRIDDIDRNGLRTPMQWNNDMNGGFSQTEETKLYRLPIRNPLYGYPIVNVEEQKKDPYSILNFMKLLIKKWKEHPCLSIGNTIFFDTGNVSIMAFLRSYEKEKILCIYNFSNYSHSCYIESLEFTGKSATNILNEFEQWEVANSAISLKVEPYKYYWLKMD